MMRPILPRLPDVVGAGVQRLGDVRPSAREHVEAGRWGDPLVMWRAQCALALQRLAAECSAARLGQAEGRALFDLITSEFDAVLSPDPGYAHGRIAVYRNHGAGVLMPPGVIPAGTKFRVPADRTATPPTSTAEYESVAPVVIPSQPGGPGGQAVEVRVRASKPGISGNHQAWGPSFELISNVFDDTIRVQYGDAAGGSSAYSAAKLRALAQALSVGRYGPTAMAIHAGLLSTEGIVRIASKEYDQPGARGLTIAWFADESWCWSQQLQDIALQNLHDNWLGFGCKVQLNRILNERASVSATVMLRDKRDVVDTLSIQENVRNAVRAYFDNRPDFYTWRLASLCAVITHADRRILSCTTAAVKDSYGTVIDEPPADLPTNTANEIRHFDVSSGDIRLSFLTPA